ncbi:Up-regulated during septation-domain-containing protein [Russula compacta]|nr:Up-regulated during septation-domain-containing protein [Russula compacta]
MNGVRRLLGNVTSTPTPAPVSKDTISTSSRSSSPTKELPPSPPVTRALFIRKDRKPPPPPIAGPSSATYSPTISTPTRRKPPPSESEELHPPSHSQANGIQLANTRDVLLFSLLSSEALVDSRGYEILNAEEVEELKKEHTVLSSRVGALQKKLATEVKIRDAAQTLARLNAASSPPSRISRQSSGALEAAERKVSAAQTDLWRIQERAANIGRRLLEHRAGVLGAALAETERVQQDKDRTTAAFPDADGSRSPLASPSSGAAAAVTTPKFDGAHFFAGHEDAVVPGKQSQSRGATPSASRKELEELEAKLADAEVRVQEREAELEIAQMAAASELENARVAAEEQLANLRAASASELARAHERAAELEGSVARFERELDSSVNGREDVTYMEARIRTLEREVSDADRKADLARIEAEGAAAAWAIEKASWASERALFEQERGRSAGTSETLEKERELWEQEREELVARAKDQIADAAEGLRGLVQRFDIPLFSRESRIGVLVDALGRYLEKHNAQVSEQLLAAETEKRNVMTRELEAAKAEIQALQAQSSSSSPRALSFPTEARPSSPVTFAKDATSFVEILLPLWAAARPFRAGNGRASPSQRKGHSGPSVSISDMDVRALKTLYTPGGSSSSGSGSSPSSSSGPGRPSAPSSPTENNNNNDAGTFSVEAFAQRVQALISDDRALIERLIRFAKAHDLLKKNAERAQKLAQESNAALETYQRQVRTLEEQLARADGLEEQMEQLAAEKLAMEERATEQAQTLRQLTEANAALSARALQLAQDAAVAQDELRAVSLASEREQVQRLALLEEINMVQTENGSLRQQLRTIGKL